ncbi:MAG: radical SAM/SPASM domain-containing protein [Proteobacteria bacterium]|nr:radical SAM/SPASM domain-containing protein [Pseudomonadota bacterium]
MHRITEVYKSIQTFPLKIFYQLVGLVFYEGDKVKRQLYPYFPTYRAALGEIMNQFCRLFHKTSTYTVQGVLIEPTNFCNLKCRHCSVQNRKDIKRGYLEFDLFKKIIDTSPQLTCIILTRNGEPFLHPRIFDMIAYARQKKIHVSLYTNGILLDDTKINGIFESDLNEINFSMEGIDDYYQYNRGKDYSILASNITHVLRHRDQRKSALTVGINVAITEDSSHLPAIQQQWQHVVDYIMVEPLMGKGGKQRTAPCRTLWRNLVIGWDGEAVPCCVDMLNSLVLGNVKQQTLAEIINGENARKLRKMHLMKNFPLVCKYCDEHFG